MRTSMDNILVLYLWVSFAMGLSFVPISGEMCSTMVSNAGEGDDTSVLRDKLLSAFKAKCRPPVNLCTFNTEPMNPHRFTFIHEVLNMPFRLTFSVMAEKDAKIALAEEKTDESIFTEICIGCGWGDESVIRACHSDTCYSLLVTHTEAGLLDSGEYRSFWIEYKGGNVTVGVEGQSGGFLEWDAGAYHKRVPIMVYVGISTGKSTYGFWEFDQFC